MSAEVPEVFSKYPNCEVYLVGSRGYGLETEDSDHDYLGIFFDRESVVSPFPRFREQVQLNHNNYKVYSLTRFAQLLVKGNPNIVEVAYYRPVVHSSALAPFWDRVGGDNLYHRGLADALMGYMTQQYKRGFEDAQRENHERRAEIERIGYDGRYCAHIVRLAETLYAVLGEMRIWPDFRRSQWQGARETILEIKRGEWPKEMVAGYLQREFATAETMYRDRRDSLPTSEPLKEAVNQAFRDLFRL